MARHVTSFSELFSSSASESQIFEGLEEIIPQGELANLEANAPIVPQPEQPLVPIPEAEPLAQPEGGFLEMIQYVESFAQPEAEFAQLEAEQQVYI